MRIEWALEHDGEDEVQWVWEYDVIRGRQETGAALSVLSTTHELEQDERKTKTEEGSIN